MGKAEPESTVNPVEGLKGLIPVVKVYDLNTEKSLLVKEQKGKSGIYLITNKSNGKQYVGSAVNLGQRFGKNYFSFAYLNRAGTSIINAALLKYGYSNFWVTIIEYVEPTRVVLYSRETFWIAFFKPVYNILQYGSSPLGFKHSTATKELISLSRKGELNSQFGVQRFGLENPFFGINHTEETKNKMAAAKGTRIYVYRIDALGNLIFVDCFVSANKAAIFIGYSRPVVIKYARSGELLKVRETWYKLSLVEL